MGVCGYGKKEKKKEREWVSGKEKGREDGQVKMKAGQMRERLGEVPFSIRKDTTLV